MAGRSENASTRVGTMRWPPRCRRCGRAYPQHTGVGQQADGLAHGRPARAEHRGQVVDARYRSPATNRPRRIAYVIWSTTSSYSRPPRTGLNGWSATLDRRAYGLESRIDLRERRGGAGRGLEPAAGDDVNDPVARADQALDARARIAAMPAAAPARRNASVSAEHAGGVEDLASATARNAPPLARTARRALTALRGRPTETESAMVCAERVDVLAAVGRSVDDRCGALRLYGQQPCRAVPGFGEPFPDRRDGATVADRDADPVGPQSPSWSASSEPQVFLPSIRYGLTAQLRSYQPNASPASSHR